MKTRKGLTVLEVIIVLAVIATATVLFFIQKLNVDAMNRDADRKIAINAMFFSLEEGFFAEHGYYPEVIGPDNLPTMDPNLFTDPAGFLINTDGSSFIYEPSNCVDGRCRSYILRAILEREDVFIRQSRH